MFQRVVAFGQAGVVTAVECPQPEMEARIKGTRPGFGACSPRQAFMPVDSSGASIPLPSRTSSPKFLLAKAQAHLVEAVAPRLLARYPDARRLSTARLTDLERRLGPTRRSRRAGSRRSSRRRGRRWGLTESVPGTFEPVPGLSSHASPANSGQVPETVGELMRLPLSDDTWRTRSGLWRSTSRCPCSMQTSRAYVMGSSRCPKRRHVDAGHGDSSSGLRSLPNS
jgi:hypothetical protein